MLEFDADYISGPDWLFGTFGAGNFQGEPDLPDALWKGCYGLINRSLNAESHIAAMQSLTNAQRNNAIGEMRFQRAFAYFLLARAYGDIPIQNAADFSQPRRPVAEVYDTIINLLDSSTRLMYKNTDSDYQPGHVNAGSAAGLLAKVYATMAAAAMPEGTEVIIRSGAPYYTDGSGDKQYAALKTFHLSR